MAGFLRRKPKFEEKQSNSNLNNHDSGSSATSVPPLYARFASTSAKQDVSTTTSRPVVSGPMSLASARKVAPSVPVGHGHRNSKSHGADDRRLVNRSGKWNRNGYDVRAPIGHSNATAPDNGYLTTDPHAAPSANGSGSRAGSDAQAQKSSIVPTSASRVPFDKSLSTTEMTSWYTPASAPTRIPAKDRRLSKSLSPTRPSSFLTPPEAKPLPVPDAASPPPNIQHSPLSQASRQSPDLPFLSYDDSPFLDTLDKGNHNPTAVTSPGYPLDLAQHLLSSSLKTTAWPTSKVEKDLPPQPICAPTPPSNGAVGQLDALMSLNNEATSPPRIADPPSPKKSHLPSFSRISFSRPSHAKVQRQKTQSVSTSIPRISLDQTRTRQSLESSTVAVPPRSRVPSGPKLPSGFGHMFKAKDKGKRVTQMDNSSEICGDSGQSDKTGFVQEVSTNMIYDHANHFSRQTAPIASVHSFETSESLPPGQESSQSSATTIASRSSSSNVQLGQSHRQGVSSTDLRPSPSTTQEPTTSHPAAVSEFSTNSASTMKSSVPQSLHSSISTLDPSHQLPARTSLESRRDSPKSSNPPDFHGRKPSGHLFNPPRRIDLLPVTNIKGTDYFGQHQNLTSPLTQQQEVRRVPGSSANHARQTSMQLRKGPLIFAATADIDEPTPANQLTPPSSLRAQPAVSHDPEMLKFMNDDFRSGLEAYPSPPMEPASLIEDTFTHGQQPKGPLSTDLEESFISGRRQPEISQVPQHPLQPQLQPPSQLHPQIQSKPLYRSLSQSQSFPSQLPRRQIPHAQSESQPQTQSQTHVRSQLSDFSANSQRRNGHDRSSSDTLPKPRQLLTKNKQPSAIPRPTTPPIPPRRSTIRLDSSIKSDDQKYGRSGQPGTNHAPGMDHLNQAEPSPIVSTTGNISFKDNHTKHPSKQDLDRMPDINPITMKERTRTWVDHNPDTSIPLSTSKPPPASASPEARVREQFRRQPRESQPQPLNVDSIPQQATSTGPYDPVLPRARPRPMTVFSMTAFSLSGFLSDAGLLFNLLSYLTFHDWVVLSNINKQIRTQLQEERDLREEVLERYLDTVGYERWTWDEEEPLSLSLQDLNEYLRGVSMPNHQYARLADQCLQLWKNDPMDKFAHEILEAYSASTRAYTRIVLRLRAQAEAADVYYTVPHTQTSPTNGPVSSFPLANSNFSSNQSRSYSRPSSRAPSPAASMFSNAQHTPLVVANQITGSLQKNSSPHHGSSFRSPLFKLRRAPLLRVFVPSPDGDWLSDGSVLECEAQLKVAGVLKLLRSGDVVWDVAVGDEGNVGRLIWDGRFLIDLDYSYSRAGDLPQYLHTLAFPPSYFHRVIRTSPANSPYGSNPIVHIDISPWGEEIAANLQLLQDRMRTETPQGSHHNVVRWVHRSSFVIRPPPVPIAARYGPNRSRIPPARIPIPQTDKLFVDPGWHGTIVVEAEGTNEGLADLQDRCGGGVFPPRARAVIRNPGGLNSRDGRKVFRLLREKSRPGEIWLRTVGEKERLM